MKDPYRTHMYIAYMIRICTFTTHVNAHDKKWEIDLENIAFDFKV